LWLSLVLVIVVPLLDAAAILLFKVLVDDVLTPPEFPRLPEGVATGGGTEERRVVEPQTAAWSAGSPKEERCSTSKSAC
jgi:hypothetical protein